MPAKGQDIDGDLDLPCEADRAVCARASASALLVNGAASARWPSEFLASPALIFLSGVITLPAGLAIVLTHNVWVADWRVLITLLGWLAIIGGARPHHLCRSRPPSIGRAMIANPIDPADRRRDLARDRRAALLLRLSSLTTRLHWELKTMNKPITAADLVTPKVTTGPLPARARSTPRPRPRRTCACRSARSCSTRRRRRAAAAGLRHLRPLHRRDAAIDVENGPASAPASTGCKERGGVEEYDGRADQAGRQRQRLAASTSPATSPTSRSRCAALDGKPVTQFEFASAGIITKEMIYVAERENLGRKTAARPRRMRRSPTARASAPSVPAVHHAGVRARRDRARPRHHPVQHQPRRARADDHRPQLPGQDQRQHRQLGRHLLGRGGGREDGVGDPLGRRHRDGPLHRPQHPQHARMDHPQFAGADRHRADLPGAGEGATAIPSSSTGSSTRTR